MKELRIPQEAKNDPKSVEVLRAWLVNDGLQCVLTPGAFGDEELIVWGVLLSDIANHVADALHKTQGLDRKKTLKTIQRHFNSELESPTQETQGEFRKN